MFHGLLWVVALLAAAPAQTLTPELAAAEAFLFTPDGFAREGRPVWATGDQNGQLQIVVRDAATGLVTPCRVNVVGPDGNFYQPPANRLSPFALTGTWPAPGSNGNRPGKAPYRYYGRFFYTTGESTVAVPPGPVRIEVWKGFEYRPATITTQVKSGAGQRIEVNLTHTVPMDAAGYYTGDSHLHFLRQTEEHDRIMFDLLEAEGVRYGCSLAYNHPPGPYAGFMEKLAYPQRLPIGARSIRTRGNVHLISGQEYRTGTYGHMNLYLLDDLVFPGKNFNADHWPVYGEVAREARAKGGFAMMAHGGYAQEVWADAALGTIDSVELLQFGVYRGIELAGWYDMLNTGYRFPAAAAADYPPCRTLADCRTYVHHASAPTMPEWIAGLNQGRSFFTTGPLLLLEVDGEKPGARLRKTGAGPHTVRARVRLRCEVTPVTNLELIVNGTIVERRVLSRAEGQGRWIELDRPIELTESAWIAARAWSHAPIGQPDAEAHTNPVYVHVNNRAPFQRASLDAWVARIDGEMARHGKRTFAERAQVLAYFQRARDLLLRIRAQGGLTADEDPAKLGLAPARPAPGIRNLATDGSAAAPTDDELREFLQPVPPPPLPQALTTFESAGGFRLELVAAEPLVHSPVAAAFDEDGNLYVAEMRDYPYNVDQPVRVAWQKNQPQPGAKPIGTVRLLRDTDGDGRYDQSTVFADGLLWAAGVQPWKGGVFVTAPPNIWYLKDTDGDGRADIREAVLTGFGAQNQQAMVNSLQFGLDHLIYASTGGNGGDIRPGNDPAAAPVSVKGRDLRFDPRTGRMDLLTGAKQFGVAFDDWGGRFLCSQADPAFHVVLPQHYLDRNPHFTPAATMFKTTPNPTPIQRISPVEGWRHIRSSRRVTEGVRAVEGEGVSHHVFDAGAGVTIYRGGAYPPEYYGNVFTTDGQNNLIHRRTLVPQGATYRTERADPKGEFVRSSDIWFRPVNMVNAPDGTLHVLDMSREYLETINIPADVEKHLDLTSGRNQGRIYRIAPPGFRLPPPPRLSRATMAELVATLESPHGWWRDTAHRLIYERQDKSAVPGLEHLAAKSRSPQARVHALWSLRGLESLRDDSLAAALADPHAGVRENALRLAEPRLEASVAIRHAVAALVSDPEPRVRLQVAFTLGESRAWDQAALLGRLARENAGDPWIRSAVLSSVAECGGALFARLAPDADAGDVEILRPLVVTVGAQNRGLDVTQVIESLAAMKDPVLAFSLVHALGEGLRRARTSLAAADRSGRLKGLLQHAPRLAVDTAQPDAVRRAAIETLGVVPYSDAAPALLAVLGPKESPVLQRAAIATLAQFKEASVAPELLKRYATFSPVVRARVLDALIERPERITALWTAIESQVVRRTDFSAAQLNQLRQHRNDDIRHRAGQLLGAANASPRQDIQASFLPALRLSGNASRGKPIFEQRCSACHQLAGVGQDFGPSLAAARTGGKEKLLTSLIDPNREVLPQFAAYRVDTRSGEGAVGFLESESAATVTLRLAGGAKKTFARTEIADLKALGQSLMPEGLEAGLSHQDVADLLAFVLEPQ